MSPRSDSVGPSPIPSKEYAARQLPVRRAVVWMGRFAVLLVALAILLWIFVVSLYKFPAGEKLLRPISSVFPIPAVRVDTSLITYKDYTQMLDGWLGAYGTEEVQREIVQERVLVRLVQDAMLAQMATELRLKVDEGVVAEVYTEFVGQHDSEAHLIEAIDRQFGWDYDQFMEFVVEPLALVRQLDSAVRGWDEAQEGQLSIIEEIRRDVINDPDRFSDIAMQDSEEGDGHLELTEYPPEALVAFVDASEGVITEVIELEDRYVIYKVLDIDEEEVLTEDIYVEKLGVYEVMQDRLDSASIKYYVQ